MDSRTEHAIDWELIAPTTAHADDNVDGMRRFDEFTAIGDDVSMRELREVHFQPRRLDELFWRGSAIPRS